MTRRQPRSRGHRRFAAIRVVVSLIAGSAAATGMAAGVPTAQAAPGINITHVASASTPVQPCAALTGLSLPSLPGSDTATVSANEVTGSGCQVAIEITDTSDPRGGQPGQIGIDVTLPDSWNGDCMAEGNGVYCSPATFVTLSDDQWLAAGYAISQDDCGHTGYLNALVSPWVTNSSPPPAVNWNRIDDFGYLAQHLISANLQRARRA